MPKAANARLQELNGALQRARATFAEGGLVQAEQHCLQALRIDRNCFDALALHGVVLATTGRHDEACRQFGKALRIKPDDANVHYNQGVALAALGRFEAAVTSYGRSLAIRPGNAEAHVRLAIALKAVKRLPEADAHYVAALNIRREELERRPGDFQGHHHLGKAFERIGNLSAALECCRRALAIDPDAAAARGALAMYQLPAVFDDGQDPAASRLAFARELDSLAAWLDASRPLNAYEAFDNARVFYLAYSEESNLELLSRFGDLCVRTMAGWREAQALAPCARVRGDRIRVGVVMANVINNSVWKALVSGWFEFLDPGRFELHLFQIEPHADEATPLALARARHADLTNLGLLDCVKCILARDLDVLIYPEIAMHPKPLVLASLRLAGVQVVSWGHPETTGLPTVDYYLSAECLEPPHAQNNYRERLVLLPHLGCHYRPSTVDPVAPDLDRLGIASDRPLMLCPGTPFKYAPQFDRVLVEIARKLPECQLVFFVFEHTLYTERLRRRLEAVFARSGLTLSTAAAFIPWLPEAEYHGLLGRACVHLDTIGFSGFNTALLSLERDLPVVTREGRYMRGRLASGILKRIGLAELVAATEEEYIALAIRLATDTPYLHDVREHIRRSRHVLFGDLAPIRAMEQFLDDVARQSRSTPANGAARN